MSVVEYYDPDGLFPLIAPALQERLPLRNLHWKSATRPLRSIASLNVDFLPGDRGYQADSASPSPADGSSAVSDPARPAVNTALTRIASQPKARKHQIPGLRPTPFLKLYILRCDDKDSYKEARKPLIREWLRECVVTSHRSSSVTKQENHDAHEWLILHVVLPGTPASNQPRWSKPSGPDYELPKEKSSGSKWPGRGSSTILDKLRSDFNPSGKSAVDRIAQIRLPKDVVPPHMLNYVAASAPDESAQDADNAWADLIAKFKTLILLAFNLRVEQYEEDLREKESQRALPGWNFCTFFVLKEGLLRALESVGLVEDALIGYDELAAGLDATIDHLHTNQDAADLTDSFQDTTHDLHELLAYVPYPLPDWGRPLSSQRKAYSELIASNRISVFDIRSYIFSRQVTLLLHLVNPASFQQALTQEAQTVTLKEVQAIGSVDDAFALADLLQRATRFLMGMARIMREDLMYGTESPGVDFEDKANVLVHSWTFAVANQILEQTSSPSFPQPESRKPKRIDSFPSRRSSLTPAAKQQLDNKSIDVIGKEDLFGLPQNLNEVQPVRNVELASAAASRADLFLFQRRMLERLADGIGLVNTDLRIEAEDNEETDAHDEPKASSKLGDSILALTLESIVRFRAQYQNLTDRAIWYFLLAGRQKSAEKLMLDLATLKFKEGDHASASTYFTRLSSIYSTQEWSSLQLSMLKMHAESLKALNRKDDHIRIIMALIGKASELQHAPKAAFRGSRFYRAHETSQVFRHTALDIDISKMFSETVQYSRQLTYDFTLPIAKYFKVTQLEQSISHFHDRDGFLLAIVLEQSLVPTMEIDTVSVRLVGQTAAQTKEVWVESHDCRQLTTDPTRIEMKTNVSLLGDYIVDKIKVCAGRLSFIQDTFTKSEVRAALQSRDLRFADLASHSKKAKISIWPRRGALNASITESRTIHVGKRKKLVLSLDSGLNDVQSLEIVVKAASAGLRLYTTEAKSYGAMTIEPNATKVGFLSGASIPQAQQASIEIPFEIESSESRIAVKLDISYTTSNGTFVLVADTSLNTELPIAVNVQDIFKHDFLISSFQLKSASGRPIRLIKTNLQGFSSFEVVPIMSDPKAVIIFGLIEASASFLVRRVEGNNTVTADRDFLRLTLEYEPLDELVLEKASKVFSDSLNSADFGAAKPLLLPNWRSRLEQNLRPSEIEDAEESGYLLLPTYDALGWDGIIEGLPEGLREKVGVWLKQWHQGHAAIALDVSNIAVRPSRSIVIDFDPPRIPCLFTSSIRLRQKPRSGATVAVGQPLAADVQLQFTRRWSPAEVDNLKATTFLLNLRANPAIWHVVGPKQQAVDLQENHQHVIGITLIPLRAGALLLPAVDVDILAPTADSASTSEGRRGNTAVTESVPNISSISCETDCISFSETIFVIESMKSTTIGAGKGEQLSSASRILESEPRASLGV